MIAAAHASAAAIAVCRIGIKADPRCTPGAIQSTNVRAICTPGWASAHRDVSYATKLAVRAEYGAPASGGSFDQPGSWEVDHLVPLELGGSNSVRNLWPEAYPGYATKDVEENALHDAVCSGRMTLRAAVAKMLHDWLGSGAESRAPSKPACPSGEPLWVCRL